MPQIERVLLPLNTIHGLHGKFTCVLIQLGTCSHFKVHLQVTKICKLHYISLLLCVAVIFVKSYITSDQIEEFEEKAQ